MIDDLASIFGLPLPGKMVLEKIDALKQDCPHHWVVGPFSIMAAVTYEEPDDYPPTGTINLEHCTQCGLLRLPLVLRRQAGRYLRS